MGRFNSMKHAGGESGAPAPVLVPTEGEYFGIPTLALPTGKNKPVIMTLGKWRTVVAHYDAVKEFIAKNADYDLEKKQRVDPDARRKALMAELAALGAGPA